MQLLHHIIDHPEEYQAKKEIVDNMEMKTVEQMRRVPQLLPGTSGVYGKELPEDKIDRVSFSRDWLLAIHPLAAAAASRR